MHFTRRVARYVQCACRERRIVATQAGELSTIPPRYPEIKFRLYQSMWPRAPEPPQMTPIVRNESDVTRAFRKNTYLNSSTLRLIPIDPSHVKGNKPISPC